MHPADSDLVARVYVHKNTPITKRHNIIIAIAELNAKFAIAVEPVAPPRDENPDELYVEDVQAL